MDCPACRKTSPDDARFCAHCGAALAAAPAPSSAPEAATPTRAAGLSLPAQLALGCGVPIVGVLLILAVGFVIYLRNEHSHTRASQEAAKVLGQSLEESTPEASAPTAGTGQAAPRLAGEWKVVYFSGEGDPPTGLTLREEGGKIVGELLGRYETKVSLSGSGDGKWTGTYADANRPSGTRTSAEMPGRDRLRLTDEDSPGGPAVLLVADRPGGADFGPHARAETKDEAIDAVAADPKVAAWLKLIDEARASGRHTKAHIDIEEDVGDWYIAHVYELVEDEGGSGHTATFGRYYVYKRSGVVAPFEGA